MTNTFYMLNLKHFRKVLKVGTLLLFTSFFAGAQTGDRDSLLAEGTLDNVVMYAVRNQPYVQQAILDQDITNMQIKGKLADWYPQISAQYNYQRNIQLLTSVIVLPPAVAASLGATGPLYAHGGTTNLSTPQLYGTWNLFNRDVLLAGRTASDVRTHSAQVSSSTRISAAVNTTKAFYDVLATTQAIKLGQGDILRLKQSLKTAYDQYQGGIVDKTDYKRAIITLKNTEAVLKSNEELLKYKMQYLKALMGYPPNGELKISYDSAQMEEEIPLDTLQSLNPADRIDYKILDTNRKLQSYNLKYARWAFLPTVQAYGYWVNYYYGNTFGELYDKRFPNTYYGATVTLPLFQGFKRTANIRQQKYSLARVDQDIANFKNTANAQYQQALAAYKGYLATYLALKENLQLAKEVYDIIQLQYKTGIKTYLDVITAETDLRNSRTNYVNALYQVLGSKVDVQNALGQINY
jgi:outer membrane protein